MNKKMTTGPNRPTKEKGLAGKGQNPPVTYKTVAKPIISVVIPNHNGAKTIGLCLQALLVSRYDSFEIIVVDDCSTDNSRAMIEKYPCRLLKLKQQIGAARARNIGAEESRGEIIFFTDADCLVLPDTLLKVMEAVNKSPDKIIIGGTYAKQAADDGFFANFQSVFINYSELKNASSPDYIATHALAMRSNEFKQTTGFAENFLPILEDVEFCHRLRQQGFSLRMIEDILVGHIFNFSFAGSMRNAFIKSRFWSMYSLENKDIFTDSGTASHELKLNVSLFFILLAMVLFGASSLLRIHPAFLLLPFFVNLVASRKFLGRCMAAGGLVFAIKSGFYYMFIYPLAVGTGAVAGILNRHELYFYTDDDIKMTPLTYPRQSP